MYLVKCEKEEKNYVFSILMKITSIVDNVTGVSLILWRCFKKLITAGKPKS